MNNSNHKFFGTKGNCFPKLTLITVSAVIMLLASGCKKFLDVPPKDKVPQATLFTDEQGFKDALIGIYLGMDKPQNAGNYGLYTTNFSMGMMSTLAYQYDNATVAGAGAGSFYNNVVYYFYNEPTVRQEIDGLWGGMYNNIANLNNMLIQVNQHKDVFHGDNYNRIKGEAIALRGLFHFDLLRSFGQPPLTGASAPAIPYVTQFTIKSTPFVTLQAGLDSCVVDLLNAKDLLAAADTTSVIKAAEDPFTSYTQNHLNYWAVKALLARVYLYKGDYNNAEKYAKEVIGSNKFPLITSNIAAATNIVRDRIFSQELLFAVYSSNVKNYNSELFDKSGSAVPLRLLPAGKNAVYTTGSGNASDYRYISWFDNSQGGLNVPSKFFQDNNLPYELQNQVPVIRVSEMYYIAAECANNNGAVTTGTSYINNVRQARGLTGLNAAGFTNPDSLSIEILHEYQKEFIQEGQTWFYYKRLNKDLKQVTTTTASIPADVYVFPIPDKEKEYNH